MLPFVPAGHAVNPEGSDALIFDPFGTTTVHQQYRLQRVLY